MSNKTQVRSKKWRIYISVGLIGITLVIVPLLYIKWQTDKCEEYTALLEVSTDKQIYAQREPILITTKVWTSTAPNLGLAYDSSPLMESEIYVFDEQGQAISLTQEGEIEIFAGSRIFGLVPPELLPYERIFSIDTWFDLSKSGTYTLTLEKKVWYEDCEGMDTLKQTVVFTRLP